MTARYFIRIGITAAVFLVFALHLWGVVPLRLVDQLENLAYDARIRLTMPSTADPRVVIVDIDEASQAREGQWPWPRSRLAVLMNQLFDRYQVRVVGFDMVFPEPDARAGTAALDALAAGRLQDDAAFQAAYHEVRPSLETDRLFAEALRGRPTVMGYVLLHEGDETERSAGALPRPVFAPGEDPTRLKYLEATGHVANLPVLQENALTGGFFSNPSVSIDGSFRKVPMLERRDGAVYEALALATLRVALGRPPLEFEFYSREGSPRDNLDLEWLKLGELRVPVDEQLALWVPYRGEQGSFPYVSAAAVMAGEVPQETLEGRIVLIGTSAAGLKDLRVTPVGEAYNGVEVHANIVSGILDQRVKHHPEYVFGIHLTMLVFGAAVLTWVLATQSVVLGSLVTLAFVVAGVGMNLAAWQWGNFIVPYASPVLFVIALFMAHTLYGFFIESRGKRQLATQFGQYVPPELVEEMDRNPGDYSFAGQAREMTVLFSDVRNFTSISEGLTAEQLGDMMNAYLTPMTEAIHRQRGTIDKYIGDAIMAFWGAPLEDREHARHAVLAGLAMSEVAARLRAEFPGRGWPAITIGIGINTGEMRVGDMGSAFRKQYTVMGDAVNLGSRLEGLTKEYGVEMLVSETTAAAVPEVQYLELDRVRVKGKEHPVAILTPLGLKESLPKELRQETTRHKQALALYRQQQWDAAEREFFGLYQQTKRHVYQLYLDRIAHFRGAAPPSGWDGTFTFKTK